MRHHTSSMQTVLSEMQAAGLLEPGWQDQAATTLSQMDETQPWYIRAMIAFGAWLASLMFISFVLGMSLITTEGGFLVIGFLCLLGSVVVRFLVDNDFTNQAALATNLAGQVLLAIGIVQSLSGSSLESALTSLIVINLILIPIYRDKVYRFLSIVFITGAVVALLYLQEMQAALPYLPPLLAAIYVVMVIREGYFSVRGLDDLMRPLMAGLLLSAFGCTLLSTVYILPELSMHFEIYPNPWISTLGLGFLLLVTEYLMMPEAFGGKTSPAALTTYALSLLLTLVTLPAPGLVLSLVVIILGTARGHRVVTGSGIAFLAVFTINFFYGIETSLITKSYILVGTGMLVMLGRWILLRMMQENEHA